MDKVLTDIHTHILPEVDDGASSMKEALDMLECAYNNGIRRIIATPHFGGSRYNAEAGDIFPVFQELKYRAFKKYADMQIYPGNEILYDSRSISALDEGRALTLAETNYVLTEFDPAENYRTICRGLTDLQRSGYRPILAHAERYYALDREEKIDSLTDMGVYIQINAKSFSKKIFDKKANYCIRLFRKRKIHFIASDCHGTVHRKPVIQKTIKKIVKNDKELLDIILYSNPEKLLSNFFI